MNCRHGCVLTIIKSWRQCFLHKKVFVRAVLKAPTYLCSLLLDFPVLTYMDDVYILVDQASANKRRGKRRGGATLSLGRQTTVIKWIKVCDGVSIIMIAQWGAERVQSWPVVFMCCSISICDGIYIQPKFNHVPRNVGNV